LSFLNELKRRNVLRVAAGYIVSAWLVIQVTETIFPLFGFGDTPARIVVITLAIGFIPAMIVAWVFELTPEGLKKESEVDHSQSIAPDTGKKLDRMIMVVLALALGYFTFDKFVLNPQREVAVQEQFAGKIEEARQEGRTEALVESYGDKSIAVLPFVNMSDDASNEFFSDGISEELLNLLARIQDLRVISRSSAFSYKGKDIKLAQVAEELNVAHILEGSVRKAGNKIRITAQLIEARSDTHLWSETYDRTLDDIFAVQDEIAATVVEQLKITLLGVAPKVRETDPEAYTLILQARHLGLQVSAEGIEQGIALAKQALTIDPDYTDAWVGLAGAYYTQAQFGLRPHEEGFRLAREATERALAIDPDNAAAHGSLAWIAMMHDTDLAQAARHFQRALQLDPVNLDNIMAAATLLVNLGRLDQAIAAQKYVVSRDPVNPAGFSNLGIYYLEAKRWDEAIATFRTALRLSPGMMIAHGMIGIALLNKGEAEAALAEVQQEPMEVLRLIVPVAAHHALGQQKESDAVLLELIGKYEQNAAYNIAGLLAYRNEADRAFEWLDKAVEYGDSGLSKLASDPWFTNIHNDPRWLPLLESSGMDQAKLDAIKFEVTLPK
jgi:TolB-like protein/cytochrome c-type biogenesis protein CcmH/NrfG